MDDASEASNEVPKRMRAQFFGGRRDGWTAPITEYTLKSGVICECGTERCRWRWDGYRTREGYFRFVPEVSS